MKKLFLLLLCVPLQATAAIYQCENYTPIDVCTSPDGLLQPEYEQWMWDFGQYVPVDHNEYLEHAPATDPTDWIIKHKTWYFQSGFGEDARYTAAECQAYCPAVTECGPDEIPDYEGFCTQVEWGPYTCGAYSGDMPCYPDTGEPTQEFINDMYAEGLLHIRTDHTYERAILWATRRAEALFATGVTSSNTTTFFCSSSCDLTPDCPDGQGVDELGFCADPPPPPEAVKIFPEYPLLSDACSTTQCAANTAIAQMEQDGIPYYEYGSVIFWHAGAQAFYHFFLNQEIGGEVRLQDIVEDLGSYEPRGYVHRHAIVDEPLSTGPSEADYAKALILETDYGLTEFYVLTGEGTLVKYLSSGTIEPPPPVICNPYRGCPEDPVEPPPADDPPPTDDPVVICNPYRGCP